jgi:hypothetical protein
VAFSPNGKLLVAGERRPEHGAGGVLFWNMDVAWWRQRACQVANRNLSCAEWRTYFGEDEYRPVCPELPAPPACPRP